MLLKGSRDFVLRDRGAAVGMRVEVRALTGVALLRRGTGREVAARACVGTDTMVRSAVEN